MLNTKRVLGMLKFIPQNYNLLKRVFTSFNNLHYDANDEDEIDENDNFGVLYSLAGSKIHELRGKKKIVSLPENDSLSLIKLAGSISEENSILDVLMNDYITHQENRTKGSKKINTLSEYFRRLLLDEKEKRKFNLNANKKGLCNDDWIKDMEFLCSDNYIINVVQVYTQALIHSNLFDACEDYHHNLKTLTLAEMVDRNYKKPFVCYIDKDNDKKYFGVVKYFFRLNYTTGVLSVPVCAVHWVNFEIMKDSVNCSIGRIRGPYWKTLAEHADKNILKKNFVSFNDLEPSRYALSYIPEQNQNAYYINMAFIALDSEKLGEQEEDRVHADFGDNMFPHYLGTLKTSHLEENADIEDQKNLNFSSFISEENIEAVKQYVPESVLAFMRK